MCTGWTNAALLGGDGGKGVSFTLIVLSVPIVLSPFKFQQKLERENDELRVEGGGLGYLTNILYSGLGEPLRVWNPHSV